MMALEKEATETSPSSLKSTKTHTVAGVDVAETAAVVAYGRLQASLEDNPLIYDPYVMLLLGQEGLARSREFLSHGPFNSKSMQDYMAFRTRFGDETALTSGIQQIVILASGVDTRAWRLQWRQSTTVFEVDRSEIFEVKQSKLPKPPLLNEHISVVADLGEPGWTEKLQASGFDATKPTAWLAEGLLMYLTPSQIQQLFAGIVSLTAAGVKGSRLFFDQVDQVDPYCQFFPLFESSTVLTKLETEDCRVLLNQGWTFDWILSTEKGFQKFGRSFNGLRDSQGHSILPTYLVQMVLS